MKIQKPSGGGIMDAPLLPEFSDFGNDRFIANEIEILKSYRLREIVANAFIDSFNNLILSLVDASNSLLLELIPKPSNLIKLISKFSDSNIV